MRHRMLAEPGMLQKAALISCAFLVACSAMSQTESDPSAGFNGGFESERSGLPVNWILYTPETVPEADFDLVVDSGDFHSGVRSLKFVVRECSGVGGWRSPGFCNEFPPKHIINTVWKPRPRICYRIGLRFRHMAQLELYHTIFGKIRTEQLRTIRAVRPIRHPYKPVRAHPEELRSVVITMLNAETESCRSSADFGTGNIYTPLGG